MRVRKVECGNTKHRKHFWYVEHYKTHVLKPQFPSKLRLLKKISAKVAHLATIKEAKNILLFVLSLLIFDVLVSVLGTPYLSENIALFLDKSRTVILSDLLFFEGTVTFAIGTFIVVLRFMQEQEPSLKPPAQITENEGQTGKKRIHDGIFMMVTGAILMVLSISIGTLLL